MNCITLWTHTHTDTHTHTETHTDTHTHTRHTHTHTPSADRHTAARLPISYNPSTIGNTENVRCDATCCCCCGGGGGYCVVVVVVVVVVVLLSLLLLLLLKPSPPWKTDVAIQHTFVQKHARSKIPSKTTEPTCCMRAMRSPERNSLAKGSSSWALSVRPLNSKRSSKGNRDVCVVTTCLRDRRSTFNVVELSAGGSDTAVDTAVECSALQSG